MRKIIFLLGGIIVLLACAKLESPLENKAHPADWADPQSTEFHANKVIAIGTVSCISCHGQNLSDNQSFCVQCHQKQSTPISYPHPDNWLDFKSATNHGTFVKENAENLTCNHCHEGQNDLATPCASCHVGS